MNANCPWQTEKIIHHTQRVLKSYEHWVGQSLFSVSGSLEEQANALFKAPFVVVSHGTEADPIFNYANQQALALWEMDWATFTQIPSRESAEPIAQSERDQLLVQARSKGYIDNYRGIRISSTGRRFWIENAILWTVLNEESQPCGQAATFSTWTFI
jgi:hypothetical protein